MSDPGHPRSADGPTVTAPVTVASVELLRIDLPLAMPFRSAGGVVATRDVLLVGVHTDSGVGWAECVAPGEPTYTAEYVAGAEAVIADVLAPMLCAAVAPISADDVARELAGIHGHHMAKAALESAVLDAELRAAGRSLASYLGASVERVPAGVAVGVAADVEALVDEVQQRVSEGYRRVKLKVLPGWDLEPVSAVRRAHPDIALQVDANGSYRPDQSDHGAALRRLDELGLVLIEQPFGADELAAHAALARVIETPVCLDESITSVASAALAIDLGSCSVVNVKAGRVGGLAEAAAIHDLCVNRGVDAWVGGMHETGLGRAEALALAALPGFTLPPDLSASARYYSTDIITEPFVLTDGALAVPTGPGLGVELDGDRVAALTTSRRIVER